jgi:hypothetical protein
LHGRRICRPRPLCDKCAVRDECVYFETVVNRDRAKPPRRGVRGRDGGKRNAAGRVRTPRR